MKTVVVCEEDPSYSAAIAHLLFVGIATLALTNRYFKDVVVRVVGNADGWSPFCMNFYGECSDFKQFDSKDLNSNVLMVVSYSSCQKAKLISVGLQRFVTSVLSIPLLESVSGKIQGGLSNLDNDQITTTFVKADQINKYYKPAESMEKEQIYLTDCLHVVLELLQKVVATV